MTNDIEIEELRKNAQIKISRLRKLIDELDSQLAQARDETRLVQMKFDAFKEAAAEEGLFYVEAKPGDVNFFNEGLIKRTNSAEDEPG